MVKFRARSQEAKLARRQLILKMTEQILRTDGFDRFTMNRLASTAGLAKGTIYLYFPSREELVLCLYTDLNERWISHFLTLQQAGFSENYQNLCVNFYECFVADDLLVNLAARASSLLEPCVSISAWVIAKKAYARIARRLGGMFCTNYNCSPSQGQRLAWAFLVAITGAQQRAIERHDNQVIPEELQKLGQIVSCKEVFLNIVLPLAPMTIKRNTDLTK